MLAGMRSCFPLSFLLVFSVAGYLPVQAQIHGVPASVTSFGFGGRDNPPPRGRASGASLGPNGYGNSPPGFWNRFSKFFFPANSTTPLLSSPPFASHPLS